MRGERTVPLEARYSSRPFGDRVLKNMTTLVDMERRDFCTTEYPLPSKWNDVSSVRQLMDQKQETRSSNTHLKTSWKQRRGC